MKNHLIWVVFWAGGFWLITAVGRTEYLANPAAPIEWKEHYWLVSG